MAGQKTDEKGMMTVEAVLCLVPFILVILGIISFTNIFMVHSRIQHAIYESASELSAYTYLYQVSRWREADQRLDEDSAKLTSFLESCEEAREKLSKLPEESNNGDSNDGNSSTGAAESVEEVINQGVGLLQKPKELVMECIVKLMSTASGKVKDKILEWLGSWMVAGYLEQVFPDKAGQSADEYLKAFGVKDGTKGLNFNNSKLFTDDDQHLIDIIVDYDLEIYFFKLFFKDPTIHVVQRVTIPAWLDGDGGTYYAD